MWNYSSQTIFFLLVLLVLHPPVFMALELVNKTEVAPRRNEFYNLPQNTINETFSQKVQKHVLVHGNKSDGTRSTNSESIGISNKFDLRKLRADDTKEHHRHSSVEHKILARGKILHDKKHRLNRRKRFSYVKRQYYQPCPAWMNYSPHPCAQVGCHRACSHCRPATSRPLYPLIYSGSGQNWQGPKLGELDRISHFCIAVILFVV